MPRHDISHRQWHLFGLADGRILAGWLAEIFIDAHKPDSELAVHANTAAVLASLLLQHGVTAAAIRHSIAGPLATALAHVEEGEP